MFTFQVDEGKSPENGLTIHVPEGTKAAYETAFKDAIDNAKGRPGKVVVVDDGTEVNPELTDGDFVYTLSEDGKSATITEYRGKDAAMNIPATVGEDKVKVTAIQGNGGLPVWCSADHANDWWNLSNTTITSVTIPAFVTTIGEDAFWGMAGLTSVEIPGGVETIGPQAFSATGLTKVTIPVNVKALNNKAFYNDDALTEVTIQGNPTYGSQVFEDCGKLETVTFTGTVSALGDRMFAKSTALTDVYFASATAPAKYAGEAGKLFQNVDQGEGVAVHVPTGAKAAYEAALEGELHDGLVEVVEGNDYIYTVSEDKKSVTLHQVNVRPFVIPDKIEDIPVTALQNEGDAPIWTDGQWWSLSDDTITSVTIPASVTTIGAQAFAGLKGLTKIDIPAKVTTIGNSAFYGCGLTEVSIPTSVTDIGDNAFYGCGLKEITLPVSVKKVGNGVFNANKELLTATIRCDATYGKQVFEGCTKLKTVTFTGKTSMLGDRMFAKSTALIDVYFASATAPAKYAGEAGKLFQNVDQGEGVAVHVPTGAKYHPSNYTAVLSSDYTEAILPPDNPRGI